MFAQRLLLQEPVRRLNTTLNNCGANYAKLLGQPFSAPFRIQDRFTSSVWNFWRWITTLDVCFCVSHVVAGANERRLYSQASRRRPFSVYDLKLDHFTLLFCRGRRFNVQSCITHMHSYCFAHETFCLLTFSLPSLSWFAKARVKRRTSHEPNRMLMKLGENKAFFSTAFDSAPVKYGIWPGP